MIETFKEYWADAIAFVNQMAVPAMQHGGSMADMNNDTSLALYSESLTNFGTTYTATHESIKSQATSLAPMQGQLANIQQFCIAVGQQPPSSVYAPAQQQHRSNSRHSRRSSGGHNGSGLGGGKDSGSFSQQPTIIFGSGNAGAQQSTRLPTPDSRLQALGELELPTHPWQ